MKCHGWTRLLSLFLLVTALLAEPVHAASSDGDLDNFQKLHTFKQGQFTDVQKDAWYADSVRDAFEYGLMFGTSDTEFRPDDQLTIAQVLTIACRINNIYYGGKEQFRKSDPWYQTYVDYAIKKGIIYSGEYKNYSAAASRGQIAAIFANSLPAEALRPINKIEIENTDVTEQVSDEDMINAIYVLYCAGILTGYQDATLRPNDPVTRAQIAAVSTRMVDPDLRVAVSPAPAAPSDGLTAFAFLQEKIAQGGGSVTVRSDVSPISKAESHYWITGEAGEDYVYGVYTWKVEDGCYGVILQIPKAGEQMQFIVYYAKDEVKSLSADSFEAYIAGPLAKDYTGNISELKVSTREGPNELVSPCAREGVWMLPRLLNVMHQTLLVPNGYSLADLGLKTFPTTDISLDAFSYLADFLQKNGSQDEGVYYYELESKNGEENGIKSSDKNILMYSPASKQMALSKVLDIYANANGREYTSEYITLMTFSDELETPYTAEHYKDGEKVADAYVSSGFTGANAMKISAESDTMFQMLTAAIKELMDALNTNLLVSHGYSPADLGFVSYLGIRS